MTNRRRTLAASAGSAMSGKHYSTPKLREFGDVGQLTQAGSGLDTENMSDATLVNMLDLLRTNVQSDHYLSESLKHLMREQDLQGQSYTAFIRAAASIESDSYSAGVFEDLGKETNLSDDQLSELLQATSGIQSDHYLTEVLTSLASQVRSKGDGVQAACRNAAKGLKAQLAVLRGTGNLSQAHWNIKNCRNAKRHRNGRV